MDILQAVYLISSPSVDKCPLPDRPEYAFIGRSNVGKSSLINALAMNEKLARTSNTPGKTQLINHFSFRTRPEKDASYEDWYLVDLPGYGFAKRSQATRKEWSKMTDRYLTERPNLMQVFLLIDSRHSPQKIDLEFAAKLYQQQVAYTLIFTKTDKENQRTVAKNIKEFSDALLKQQQFLPQMIATSALKKTGRQKVLKWISELNTEFQNPE
ncbi:MAG: YihA family ribosome biogenesis GTP-binding protein [Chitinophagaceae bacterium]|nr:YihA family ribosome biogenesis GTP-binding protein [Chitinophagaceae bacterium]